MLAGMSFSDLPPEWPTLPLHDPKHIADVLDLFVEHRARLAGSLVILVCDELRRPLQPVVIEGTDPHPPSNARRVFAPIAANIAASAPGAGVLCAIARRAPLRVSAGDRAWQRCIHEAFGEHVDVLGVHLVTLDGSRPITGLGSAA